ncbi:RNA polymerase II transcription factor SIII subunit A-domain-containing protein [Flammula alnicola]|nr:RNA polymerase II transcription factor SIII subunit A-domain-containing protein [Flammula alnicola]
MDTDHECHYRRLPTLVQLCQRAAVAHVDSICSLGDDLTYPLVKPILERCSIEQLLRLEQSSPHLQSGTTEIWKDLCFRKYRLTAVERYSIDDDPQEPDSWKSRYFALQDAEAKRIEEVGSRLRTQRMEADERKKEKEVKYTERLPDAKRARTGSGWNSTTKTLFQRTRHEASKIQRAYNTRVLPPAPTSKSYRVLPQNSGAALPSASSSTTSSRVTVNTVVHRRSSASSTAVASSSVIATPRAKVPVSKPLPPSPTDDPKIPPPMNNPRTPSLMTGLTTPCASSEGPPVAAKSPTTLKKDPMACLFVPKRNPKGQVRRPI